MPADRPRSLLAIRNSGIEESMKAKIDLVRNAHIEGDATELFEMLSDLPKTMSHFPKLRAFSDLGDGMWLWDIEPIHVAGMTYELQVVTRFTVDADKRVVTLTPVTSRGNAEIGGHFCSVQDGEHALLKLDIAGTIEVDVPMLLRAPAKPFIRAYFARLVDRFIERIQAEYT